VLGEYTYTLWMATLLILLHMILIRGDDPGTAVLHIYDHDAQTGGVAGCIAECDALAELEGVAGPRLPVHVELEVMR